MLVHATAAWKSAPAPLLLWPGEVCSTAFTGVLSAGPAPFCEEADADVDAELPDADLSSESPKSRECRVSVLL